MSPSSTDTDTPAASHSFLGLQSYTEKDAAHFFGRSEPALQLYQLVKYNTLTLVFGKSGTGKTSLLNAGVFPKLRNDNCLPFPIRLVFKRDSPSLVTQVWQVLKTQVAAYDFKIETYIEGETLWEFFHRENLWRIVTPVLVFDQWEEIFTIASKYQERKAELDDLLTELADLIENIIPAKVKARYLAENKRITYEYRSRKVKVIFAFREDFLAEMESVTVKIPSVKNTRFRLMPMNGANAMEVITKTWETAIGQPEAFRILTYLVVNTDEPIATLTNIQSELELLDIEPSLLSQVCDTLDRQRQEKNLSQVSAGFLDQYPKENILRSIYDNALHDSVKENDPQAAIDEKHLAIAGKPAKKFIEENLVDANGFRDKYVSKDIPAYILPVITGLKSRFFIRQDGVFIELTHDVIAGVIKTERTVRLKAEARRNAFKKAVAIIVIAALIAIAGLAYTGQKVKANLETIKMQEIQLRANQNELKASANGETNTKALPRVKPKPAGTDTLYIHDTTTANQDSLIALLQYRIDTCMKAIEIYKSTSEVNMIIVHDTLRTYQTENSSLRKRLNYLLADTGVIHNYSTLVESVWTHRDSSKREIKESINALKINWEPFQRRTLEARSQ